MRREREGEWKTSVLRNRRLDVSSKRLEVQFPPKSVLAHSASALFHVKDEEVRFGVAV